VFARPQRRRRLLALALLALAGAAVALAVLLNAGTTPAPKERAGTAGRRSRTAPTRPRPAARPGSATTPPTSTATASASSTAAAVTPGLASASSPVSAVESFYALAASHQYPRAWDLADPTLRSELGGYPSFRSGQAGDRSITFDSAQTVSRSSTGATVAIRTTSVRSDGTHHCTGTVDVVTGGASGGWLLHLVHIACG
jgi:hypothetical protein